MTEAEKSRKALIKGLKNISEIDPLPGEEVKIEEAQTLISIALERLEGVKGRPIRPH